MLAAALLAGCGGTAAPDPAPSAIPSPPTAEERIERTLDARARSIERRRGALGVRSVSSEIEGLDLRGRSARVQMRLSYRVAGVTGEFGSARTLVLRRKGQRWQVERTVGRRDAEPWEVDDYRRGRTPHFVVWTPKGVDVPVDALEAGYARLGASLDGLRRRYLVVIARDGERARRITGRIEGLESLTALTDTQVSVAGAAERVDAIRSQRLIIVAATFAISGPENQEQVVTHELAHAVLAPRTSARTPGWLVEGVALVLSGDDRRSEYFGYRTVPTLAGLAAPDAIGRLTGRAQAVGYATASAAAFYLADTYGMDSLLELLAAFNRERLRGQAGDPELTDRALQRVLGIGIDELQERLG